MVIFATDESCKFASQGLGGGEKILGAYIRRVAFQAQAAETRLLYRLQQRRHVSTVEVRFFLRQREFGGFTGEHKLVLEGSGG